MSKPTTFEEFWCHLVSDDVWYDRIKYQYANKDIKGTAQECYIDLLAQSTRWQLQDYTDFRRCFQKWLMNAKAAPVKPQLQQVQEEPKKNSAPVVTGEERQRYIKEWLESVKKVEQQASLVPKLTHKQIADEGDWLPPKDKPYPSTDIDYLIQSEVHIQYLLHNYNPVTRNPNIDWKEEQQWIKDNEKEINEWLKQKFMNGL